MVFGHNSNVKVGETTFHVQTEDRGVTTALIDTTVYYMGRVMHRRANNYHDLIPLDPDREEALRLRLDEQHRSTLEDIRSGALYLAPPPPPAAAVPKEAQAPVSRAPETRKESPTENVAALPSANGAAGGATGATGSSGVSGSNGANSSTAGGVAAGSVAAGGVVGSAGAKNPADPTSSALKLELRNAQSWLSGKQAKLEISVTSPTGEPLADAKVIAYVEGAATPEQYFGETDAQGHAQISFTMPRLSGAQVALVIEAERDHGAPMSRAKAHGKLRFALRSKPRPA
jgi:hypothetical protein